MKSTILDYIKSVSGPFDLRRGAKLSVGGQLKKWNTVVLSFLVIFIKKYNLKVGSIYKPPPCSS